jgi:kynurenine formamidase
MKIYDLSQPLNEQVSFWPYYPPFEVKYIKRKAEHGVNAQYIQTSNHMGTHLDAPRHFVTAGMTIDEIPVEWLCGPGVIVNLSDEMDELAIYTPKMIEDRVEVRKGDLLFLHTGGTSTRSSDPTPTRRNTSIVIRVLTQTWCRGCSRKRSTSGASTAFRRITR